MTQCTCPAVVNQREWLTGEDEAFRDAMSFGQTKYAIQLARLNELAAECSCGAGEGRVTEALKVLDWAYREINEDVDGTRLDWTPEKLAADYVASLEVKP